MKTYARKFVFLLQVPCGGALPENVKCKKADTSVCKENQCGQHQVFKCNVDYGLKCVHADQPRRNGKKCVCCDWKVKFLCPAGKNCYSMQENAHSCSCCMVCFIGDIYNSSCVRSTSSCHTMPSTYEK